VSPRAPSDPQSALSLVPRALFGSSVAVLAVGLVLNSQGQTARGPEALSWLATGWALVAVVVAVLLRGQGLVVPPEERAGAGADPREALRRNLVFFGVLEGACLFAGIAAIVSPPWWPLAAALLPLAVMALNLPPRPSRG
jgi:hypothetical protein